MNLGIKVKHVLILGILLFGSSLFAHEEPLKVSGFITAAESGLALDSVYVSIPILHQNTFTDKNGFFKLETSSAYDSVTVILHKEGYRLRKIRVGGQGPSVRLLSLNEFNEEAMEVSIFGKRNTQSVAFLRTKEIKALPFVLGEPDIFKTLTFRSGFLNIGENSVGLSVRGGEPSQNLLLLDDTPVFNVSHLFGFMSSINADVVTGLNAYKGGFSADKGGRISSVLQLEMREGNRKKTHAVGGIGVLASRLAIDGPIVKDKLTYLIAGRRTFLDAIIPTLNKRKDAMERIKEPIPNYYFGDANVHLNWFPSKRDKVTAKVFGATDVFQYDNLDFDLNFSWTNQLADLSWIHFFKNNTTLRTSASYSRYDYALSNEVPDFKTNFSSDVALYRFKTYLTKSFTNSREFKTGISLERYDATIGALDAGGTLDDLVVNLAEVRNAYVGNVFADFVHPLTSETDLQTGVRISGFQGDGATYANVEPRLRVIHNYSDRLNFFISYDRMAQYIHQLYGAGFSLPVDIWYPSTQNLEPQRSHQLALGTNFQFGNGLLLNYEVYYKALDNQPELIDGALLIGSGRLDEQAVLGFGNAFAACEMELRKDIGRFSGWLSYTLAKTTRWGYPNINNKEAFPPRQDVRHNLSLAFRYNYNRRFTFSSTFAYRSGLMVWLPEQRVHLQNTGSGELGSIVPVYGVRNNVRMPAYMRLDIGCVWYYTQKRNQNFTLSLTNVTNRRNPFFYYLDPVVEEVSINDIKVQAPTRIEAKPIILFPFLPAITWNFDF